MYVCVCCLWGSVTLCAWVCIYIFKCNRISSTFVSMLSMQSRTKSGFPERISSSEDESYNSTFAVTWLSGKIDEKCFLRHWALEVPTSSLVATAWRFRDESETFTCKQYIELVSHITILNSNASKSRSKSSTFHYLIDQVNKNDAKLLRNRASNKFNKYVDLKLA